MIQTILLIWLTSIILSYSMNIVTVLRIMKDIGDEGCTINTGETNQSKFSYYPVNKNMKYIGLIPGLNIAHSFKMALEYLNKREMALSQLDMTGMIRKMTEWEFLEYNKKLTGFRAMIMPIKTEIQLSNCEKLILNQKRGEVWYLRDSTNDKIIIVKAQGLITNYSPEEQKVMIEEQIEDPVTSIMELLKDRLGEEQVDNLLKDEKLQEPTTSQKIEELKKLKDDITQDQDESKKQYKKRK